MLNLGATPLTIFKGYRLLYFESEEEALYLSYMSSKFNFHVPMKLYPLWPVGSPAADSVIFFLNFILTYTGFLTGELESRIYVIEGYRVKT